MIVRLVVMLVVFIALSWALIRYARRYGPFGGFLVALVLGVLFLKVVFPGAVLPGGLLVPGIAMAVVGAVNPLPVPGAAFWGYLVLVVTGTLLVASSSDAALSDFTRPSLVFLRGDFGRAGRAARHLALWVVFPLLVGWLILRGFMPSTRAPIESRLIHPSFKHNAELVNPLRNPDDRMLAAFADSAGFGDLPRQELATQFETAMLQQGRHLYGKNCSPCHGGKADGTGLISRALRLRPANFTDPGTIATIVEGYAFQRILDGGIGLPPAGTPWDSAMPSWKNTLSEEEIFKILLAEYDLAGVSPRIPEKSE